MVFTCADLAKNLVELEEGNASAVRRAAARFHLSICERCRRYVEQLEEVRRNLAKLQEEHAVAPSSLAAALASFRGDSEKR